MGKMMCPGQDTSFWKPGDIFEVPCSQCGHELEFFKDDATRRCTRCGQLVRNPKLNLGCAQWCEHAKECLGYDPKEIMAQAEAGESSLVDRLIDSLKAHFKNDQAQITASLTFLEWAKKIMAAEDGDPRLILAAAVLHAVDKAAAEGIMKELDLDTGFSGDVIKLISGHQAGSRPEGLEAKVLWDAALLSDISSKEAEQGSVQQGGGPEPDFKTASGKEMARQRAL